MSVFDSVLFKLFAHNIQFSGGSCGRSREDHVFLHFFSPDRSQELKWQKNHKCSWRLWPGYWPNKL